MNWLSAHLFFDGHLYGEEGDLLVVKRVPAVLEILRDESLIVGYFFIRYSVGGNHIRLRVRSRALRDHPRIQTLLESEMRRPAASVAIRDLQWIAYDPELARYGGAQALDVAESCFEASSDIAIEVLMDGRVRRDRSVRLAKGLIGTLLMLSVFGCGSRIVAAQALETYSKGIFTFDPMTQTSDPVEQRRVETGLNRSHESAREYVLEAWDRIERSRSISLPFDRYRLQLEQLRSKLTHIAECGAGLTNQRVAANADELISWTRLSLVHMSNNRLGLTPVEEAHVAAIAARSLQTAEAQ